MAKILTNLIGGDAGGRPSWPTTWFISHLSQVQHHHHHQQCHCHPYSHHHHNHLINAIVTVISILIIIMIIINHQGVCTHCWVAWTSRGELHEQCFSDFVYTFSSFTFSYTFFIFSQVETNRSIVEINKTFSHWTKTYDPDFLKVVIILRLWMDGLKSYLVLQGVQLNWTGLVHNPECIVGARIVINRLMKGMLRWANCQKYAFIQSEVCCDKKIVFSDHEKKVVVPVPKELSLQGLLLVLDCHDSLPYTIVVELIEVWFNLKKVWDNVVKNM